MDDLNQVAIAGRLTRDPQLRTTRNGTTICNLRIACNKMFFNIKIWGEQGQQLAASASKGDIVQVEGRLDWYEWSPGDGPRREFVGVVANDTPGAVRCIASSGGPSVPMGQNFTPIPGQMPGAQNPADISLQIPPVSMGVDMGMPLQQAEVAFSEPQPAMVAQMPQFQQQPVPAAAPQVLPAAAQAPLPQPVVVGGDLTMPQPQQFTQGMPVPVAGMAAQDFPAATAVEGMPAGVGIAPAALEEPVPFAVPDPVGVPVGVASEGPEVIEEDSRFI
jgi:single-strand DNA-binding protein